MPDATSFDADVGVVGAGPAGARAAELLASFGIEVVVWDPRAPWEKPCGGGLTAAALRSLPGAEQLLRDARAIETALLQADGGLAFAVPLEAPLHVVSRERLARWQLARALAAGAVHVREPVRGLERVGGGWRVTLGNGVERHVRCLVGADGAASLVRRAAAPEMRVALAATRVAFVPGSASPAGAVRVQFARGLPGYRWDFPRPDHRSIGVVVESGRWSRLALDAEVDRLDTTPTAGGQVRRAGAAVGTAGHPLRAGYPEIGGADFALLGDAAGFADPATGEGIHNALRSAELAVDAFRADRTFRRYPRLAAGCFEREFRRARLVQHLLYHRDAAVRLLAAAARHPSAAMLLVTLMNGATAHDTAVVLPWLRALVRGRRATAGHRPV